VAVILDEQQPCSVEAVTRCEAHAIPSRIFRERVFLDARVCGAVLMLHTLEALGSVARAKDSQSARRRVEQILVALARESGVADRSGWIRVALPASCENLAALIGMAPETLSRTLTQLEREAVVERGRGWLLVRSGALF
jgi:CRP/FNR family transcriptional regulator, nitrogen oxide reductase regulator